AVGVVAVGHEPTQEGLADQRGEFLLAAAADAIDDRDRCRRDPHPAQRAALTSSMSCSTTGSLARPNSWMQRSMVAVPSSRASQSARNSWIFRRERRKRSDNAAMKVASIGPTRQRSVIVRSRL